MLIRTPGPSLQATSFMGAGPLGLAPALGAGFGPGSWRQSDANRPLSDRNLLPWVVTQPWKDSYAIFMRKDYVATWGPWNHQNHTKSYKRQLNISRMCFLLFENKMRWKPDVGRVCTNTNSNTPITIQYNNQTNNTQSQKESKHLSDLSPTKQF